MKCKYPLTDTVFGHKMILKKMKKIFYSNGAGLASLLSKYFIKGAMKSLNCIYILARHQIPFRKVSFGIYNNKKNEFKYLKSATS